MHAPCEWGEKPEAESQGLTYPYPTNVVILKPRLSPSSPIAMPASRGSRAGVSGRQEDTAPARETSFSLTGTTTVFLTMWGSWNPATDTMFTLWRAMRIMLCNNSAIRSIIAELRGMEHLITGNRKRTYGCVGGWSLN